MRTSAQARMFFWIYILQILLFLWLYFLSISLGGDTYHALHPPWHWWIAPEPSLQWHHPISHGHTQTVGGLPVTQTAKTCPGSADPVLLLPCPPGSWCKKITDIVNLSGEKLLLRLRATFLIDNSVVAKLQCSASPKGGTIALLFSSILLSQG